jgi:hypothetical protein
MFKTLLYPILKNKNLHLHNQDSKNYKFLTLIYFKKIFFQKFFRRYKKKQTTLIHKTHTFIFFNLRRKNLFITFCNDLKQRLLTYSLGKLHVKNKLNRNSKPTFKLIITKINLFLRKGPTITMTLNFKGLRHKIRKFYKYFVQQPHHFALNISINKNIPHGGCRAPKQKRR